MNPKIQPVIQEPDPALDDTVQHWGFFSNDEIASAADQEELLMLDLDFGRECSLRCPTCFRRSNKVDKSGYLDLSYKEIMRVIDDACALGLKTVKVCGAGESFEDPRLIKFVRSLTERNVGLALFTKGHVIGDNAKITEVFGHEGIRSGEMLCEELFKLKVSVMLSYPTFDNQLIAQLVGTNAEWYAPRLKRAAELLSEAGFNNPRPTRLAFVHAPLTKISIGNAFEVYKFARERNILPILAFFMVSGEQITPEFLAEYDASDEAKLKLFKQVLEYNILHRFQDTRATAQ